jgi:hypothetical protein
MEATSLLKGIRRDIDISPIEDWNLTQKSIPMITVQIGRIEPVNPMGILRICKILAVLYLWPRFNPFCMFSIFSYDLLQKDNICRCTLQ